MRNKELEQCLIPGRTSFILNTNESESYITEFKNAPCRILKGTIQKNWYLIETNQSYRGSHFSDGVVEVNKFLIMIRNPLSFKKDRKQEVIVYLPSDIRNPLNFELSRTKRIAWAHIDNIENDMELSRQEKRSVQFPAY